HPKRPCAAGFKKCWLPPHHRFQVLRPMISSRERSRPPSIDVKTSARICGKSDVVRPEAVPSPTGSSFLHAPTAAQKTTDQLAAITTQKFFIKLCCLPR